MTGGRSHGGAAWRCFLVAGLLALAVAVGSGIATGVAGQQGLHHAGLIVRHGDGRLTYAYVPFREETISGIELLRRSGIEAVTIPFGGLGEGVCSLEGEGCPAAECRRRVCQGPGADDPFWQYFRQEAPGEWRWLVLGASATEVREGDIDGWSWTGGEPGLPAVTIADLARLAGADPAAPPVDGGMPPAAVRTIYPPGVEPEPPEADQGWATYAGAAGIVAAIGAGTVVAARRRAATERAA